VRGETESNPRWLLRIGLLVGCAVLLLARLGHYPLWDDEACTAILARGVWQSGDSLAIQGRNVMAYGGGTMLFGSNDRVHPPLQLYVMAPFLGRLGETALAARLPFALVGLGAIALFLRCCVKANLSTRMWVIVSVLLLTNVAMFLYLRQARYYSLAVLFSLLSAWLYLRLPAEAKFRAVMPLGLSLAVYPLVTAQGFVMLAGAFVVDYLVVGRKLHRFGVGGWAALLLPSAVVSGFLLLTWNPLVIASERGYSPEWWYRPLMFWWALRDVNVAHIGVGVLLLAGPLLAWRRGDVLLGRGCLAVVSFCLMWAVVNPQTPEIMEYAEVRHFTPLLLPCMLIAAAVISAVWSFRWWLGVSLLGLAGFTNVLHWGSLQADVRERSIQYLWARELISPPRTSYEAAIAMVRNLTAAGATVGVEPDWMRYPLMFHVADRAYTWQIRPDQRERLAHVEARQFRGVEPPEFFLSFGLWDEGEMRKADALARERGRKYERIATSPVYWRDMYRPEILRREFTERGIDRWITNPHREGVYLYQLR
jgi:4-amino-4-deoxy-L-arabinose transferase-like glycosyltransferase